MNKGLFFTLLLLLIIGGTEETSSPEKQKSKNSIVERQLPSLNENRYNLTFLIMEGMYNTKLKAPYNLFQHTQYRKNIKQMNVFTVANTDLPIKNLRS